MEPGYRQVWGLARNRGCDVHGFRLRPEDHWRPDLDALESVATPGAKLIYVCSPNNPTGYVLEAGEADRIRREAGVLVCPGVYFGCEGYLRFNFGYGADYVDGALAAMSPVVRSLA